MNGSVGRGFSPGAADTSAMDNIVVVGDDGTANCGDGRGRGDDDDALHLYHQHRPDGNDDDDDDDDEALPPPHEGDRCCAEELHPQPRDDGFTTASDPGGHRHRHRRLPPLNSSNNNNHHHHQQQHTTVTTLAQQQQQQQQQHAHTHTHTRTHTHTSSSFTHHNNSSYHTLAAASASMNNNDWQHDGPPPPHRGGHDSPSRNLFRSDHVSFLEEIARRECRNLPCREHHRPDHHQHQSPSTTHDGGGANNSRGNNNDNDDDAQSDERGRFILLDFSSDGDVSDSEEDSEFSSTEDEEYGVEDDDDNDDDGGHHDEIINVGEPHNANDGNGDDEDNRGMRNDDGPEIHRLPAEEDANNNDANNGEGGEAGAAALEGGRDEHHEAPSERVNAAVSIAQAAPISFSPTVSAYDYMDDPRHAHIVHLLQSLADSEERPLIRADIPWSVIISCGPARAPGGGGNNNSWDGPFFTLPTAEPSLLRLLYRTQEQLRDDPNGARLLQGVLRMDPPFEAVRVLLDAFPLSCLDMEGFFTACQFAHPNTSLRRAARSGGSVDNAAGGGGVAAFDEEDDDDTDDVGEVVKLVMRRTILARRRNGVDWGMVAFLGDARISPSQAKLLLRHAPEAMIDPKHGAFGVSPLDRMASGFFIHGETGAWVEKLRLALRVAAYVRQRQGERQRQPKNEEIGTTTPISLPRGFFNSDCQLLRRRESSNMDSSNDNAPRLLVPDRSFYPYHELIRLLISPDFGGNKFGRHGFLQTLRACTQSDPGAFLRMDNERNLPLHIALRSECHTALGIKGERRLIRYLLDLDNNTALCPEGSVERGGEGRAGRLPLRLSVENAWPVYDLIIDSALACDGIMTGYLRPAAAKVEPKSDSPDSHNDNASDNILFHRPLLHDALSGPYHPRFGIHGARQLVGKIISRIARHHNQQHHHHPNHGNGKQHSCHGLADFVDARGRTALHLALEYKWPAYDLLVRANPCSIEARDPTLHGFLPFQVAACSFTAASSCRAEEKNVDCGITERRGSGTMEPMHAAGSKKRKGRHYSQQANILSTRAACATDEIPAAHAAGDDEEEATLEMSMLFELIRESPLCVTWGMSAENEETSNLKRKADDGGGGKAVASSTPRQSKKRSRPSYSP